LFVADDCRALSRKPLYGPDIGKIPAEAVAAEEDEAILGSDINGR
jgi:hypothetical protein